MTEAELDDTGVPWLPRLGGRAPLGAELDQVARTGQWDRSRYAGRSEARMAVLDGVPVVPAERTDMAELFPNVGVDDRCSDVLRYVHGCLSGECRE